MSTLSVTHNRYDQRTTTDDEYHEGWQISQVCHTDVGNGQYLVVVVDDFTGYPDVEIIISLSAKVVIQKLEGLFARRGTPTIVKVDNGAPFQSSEFANYALLSGFKHRRVTPLWPEVNGEAERFVKTIKKAIREAKVERKEWHLEMYTFLRNYRATTHMYTCESKLVTTPHFRHDGVDVVTYVTCQLAMSHNIQA